MQTSLDATIDVSRADTRVSREPGMVMAWADAERFLAELADKGRSAETLSKYRYALEQLYKALPEDRTIRRGTLSGWREELLAGGYSNSTVNGIFAACDQFLAFMDCREYQLGERMSKDERPQPELSRSEYLRMLSTAKAMDDERLYLLVKTLACTGLRLNELPQLTVENIRAERFGVTFQGARRMVHLPSCLARELLAFTQRQGITEGPVFRNERGAPLHRSHITVLISKLCREARVPEEKGNPRALRRLYLTTIANIESSFQLLIEQAMDRQLEQEQLTVGWVTE